MMGRTPVPYITGGVGNDAGENDSGQKTSLPPASHAESPGGSGEKLRSLGGGSSLELYNWTKGVARRLGYWQGT